MFYQTLACAVLVFLSVMTSFSQSEETLPIPENPLEGSKVFFAKGCMKCHTIMNVGEAFGPDLTEIGRQKNFFGLAGALWSHSPKMVDIMREKDIPRPELTPEEIRGLISYIYYQGFFDERGEPQKGEELYAQKGCRRCHSLGGELELEGPSLDKYGRFVSPVYIATALWNHSSTVSEAMVGQSFAPREMSHLLAYIKENALNPEGETVYTEPGNPRQGQDVFQKKGCQVCHGPRGQSLQRHPLRKTLTEIVGMMWNHFDLMWGKMRDRSLSIPRFDNKEMADLVSYLYFISYFGEREDRAAGQRVFEEKGCILCHSKEAVEEEKGIDLAEASQFTAFELVAAMWNHVPEMEKMVTEFNLAWPRFEENEMKNLIRYIQSLK